MKPRFLLISLLLLWVGAIFLTPLLHARGGISHSIADGSYLFFGRICHQLDSHSLHVSGEKLPVCARCLAIYCSFFIGALLYKPSQRLERRIASLQYFPLIAALPMVIDVVLSWSGIHHSTSATRFVTGGFFGAGMSFLLVPHILNGINQLLNRSSQLSYSQRYDAETE
jgi:uncharacterized membrane protein